MHELSVCRGLLSQVDRIARDHQAAGVCHIRLQIGPLSGVDPHLLEQMFPLARAGTVAAGATLTIEARPVRVQCDSCGAETSAEPNRLLCGICNDWHTRLVSGDELLLASVEFVTPTVE